jgi:hypothetical protein
MIYMLVQRIVQATKAVQKQWKLSCIVQVVSKKRRRTSCRVQVA